VWKPKLKQHLSSDLSVGKISGNMGG